MKILLLVGAILILIVLALRKRPMRPAEPRPPKVVEIHAEPDQPRGFGYKCAWVAVPSSDSRAVAEGLGLREIQLSGWSSGLEAAYAYPSSYVFVTPPLSGWTLAVGVGLPDPSDRDVLSRWRATMTTLSQRFGEAQYFASHRVSSYAAWALYSAGTERRLFAWADETIYNFGEPLPEEADLMRHLPGPAAAEGDPDYWDREDLQTPEEDDVIRLAAALSFDPSTIDSLDLPASTGLVGKFPE